MPQLIDLKGRRFGRLTVVKRYLFHPMRKQTYWIALCDCGTEKVIDGKSLRCGDTRSCGCLQSEIVTKLAAKLGKSNFGRKHPHRRKTKSY